MLIRNLLLGFGVPLILAVTITTDSSQVGFEGTKAIDGDQSTFWHSQYSPTLISLPHSAVLDLGASTAIRAVWYRPRTDSNKNGNIGQYRIEVSLDNSLWTIVATGTFVDDKSLKTVSFANTNARYVRITALTEAGNRGQWTSAAELGVSKVPTETANGQWGPVITLPLVAAAAFLQPTGNILTFSSFARDAFGGSPLGYTLTSTFSPDGTSSELNVSNTGHDMFCPGMVSCPTSPFLA